MSGFTGRFSQDGGPIAPAELQHRIAAARIGAPHVCLSGPFGIAADRSSLASSPGAVAAFDGRLDNRRELAGACGLHLPAAADALSDAAIVLATYERFGDDFASRLNGDFAVAVCDVRRGCLALARDAMSAGALYYCAVRGAILFGTTIKSLLAAPGVTATPDEDGLAALVLDNWCDDERTCFKGILSVPAGQVVFFTRDTTRRTRYWTFDPERTVRYRTFGEYCEAFRSLFSQAVERRLRSVDGVAVSVSGGLDSSSILCQAAALGRAPRLRGIALTFPADPGANEEPFIDEVERAAAVPIRRLPVSTLRYLDEADAVVGQLECPAIAVHTQLELYGAARSARCDVVLSGYFADQMLADRGYLVDLVRQGRWLKVRHDVAEFEAWAPDAGAGFYLRDLAQRLRRELPPRWMFALVKRALSPLRERRRYPPWFATSLTDRAAAVSTLPGRRAPGRSTVHAAEYKQHLAAGHYVHIARCNRALGAMYGVDVRYPYRDRDLVSFLMAIPGEVINWRGVPKGLLRHALAGVVPPSILNRRSKADFTVFEYDALRRAHPQLLEFAGDDALVARSGYVDVAALRRSLADADNLSPSEEGAPPGWHLTDVVGLELWLRHFFGGPALKV